MKSELKNNIEVIKSKFSNIFVISVLISVLPFLGILYFLLSILSVKLEACLFVLPFLLIVFAFLYYIFKELNDNVFRSVNLFENHLEVKKFLEKEPLIFEYKNIWKISFEWNRSLRFIVGYGSRSYKNGITPSISRQSDRNIGGRNFVIFHRNSMICRIYENQYSNSKELFEAISNKCRETHNQS